MVDTNRIKAELVNKGLTHQEMSDILGISRMTFSNRLKKESWTIPEIRKLIEVLDLREEVFLGKRGE